MFWLMSLIASVFRGQFLFYEYNLAALSEVSLKFREVLRLQVQYVLKYTPVKNWMQLDGEGPIFTTALNIFNTFVVAFQCLLYR